MSLTGQVNLSITNTKKLLEHNFRQFMSYGPGNYLPVSMWGHAGIGKTSAVNQLRAELEEKLSKELGRKIRIGIRSFQMSAMQPFELSGYPMIDNRVITDLSKIKLISDKVFVEGDGGVTIPVQQYATPEFLVEALDYDFYICFFDEWNRARTEMHNAFMGYIDGRGVNGHKIPNNMFCVAAANPVTDDSSYGAVTDVDDQAILDRLIHINVEPSSTEYMDYLYSDKKVHDAVQVFLEEDKDRGPKNDFKGITGTIRSTNRGFADVGKAVTFLAEEKDAVIRKLLIDAVSRGIVGDKSGSLFAERFGQCEFLTTPEDLLIRGSAEAFNKLKSAIAITGGENRLDKVAKVTQNVIRFLNDTTREELTKPQLKNLHKLLKLLPHDQSDQILTKVTTFTEFELGKGGIKAKTQDTLQVTAEVAKNISWR